MNPKIIALNNPIDHAKILDEASDPLVVLNSDYQFTYANKALAQALGKPLETIIGNDLWGIYQKDGADMRRDAIKEVFETGQTKVIETIVPNPSGNLYFITTFKPIFDEQNVVISVVAIAKDVTERKQAEEKLRESEANYKQLFDNAPSGIYQVDFRTRKLIKANDVFCEYFGYSQEEITSISPYDIMTEESKKRFFERLNKMVLGEEVPENPEYEIIERDGKGVWVKLTTKYNYDSEGLAGANVVVHDIDDLKRAEEKLKDTLEGLRKAVSTTIQVMVSAVEARDPYTAGHQLRVADLARAIATEMGLPQDTIDGIRMAGSIHDIGKLSIPAEILSKPGKLSDVEFSLIKEHSRKGYEMLKDVESPWPLAEIVYQHHERMDGSGYPRNLKGDEILMEARIMAVADVVEAMASHRPYRPGLGIGAALEEIEKNRGTFYDEAVANACLRLFREKDFQLKDN